MTDLNEAIRGVVAIAVRADARAKQVERERALVRKGWEVSFQGGEPPKDDLPEYVIDRIREEVP